MVGIDVLFSFESECGHGEIPFIFWNRNGCDLLYM